MSSTVPKWKKGLYFFKFIILFLSIVTIIWLFLEFITPKPNEYLVGKIDNIDESTLTVSIDTAKSYVRNKEVVSTQTISRSNIKNFWIKRAEPGKWIKLESPEITDGLIESVKIAGNWPSP